MFSHTTSTPAISRPIVRGGEHGHRGVVGVNIVGDVGGGAACGKVGVVAQEDDLRREGARFPRCSLACARVSSAAASMRMRVRAEPWPCAAAGVFVHHLHEVADIVPAVGHDLGRAALSGGDQLAAHDEQAEIAARKVLLDDDAAGVLAGQVEGGTYLLLGGEVDADGLALVAVVGLEDDGACRGPGRPPRRRRLCATTAPCGNGHADFVEQLFGQLFVGGDFDADVGGVRGFAGLDAAGVRPCPSCTREPSLRRNQGMPRRLAASTMAWVEGPSTLSSATSRISVDALGEVEVEGLVLGERFGYLDGQVHAHACAASSSL